MMGASLGSSAKASPALLLWPAAAANGLSQVFFHTRLVTGLLILAAFAVEDWRMAVMALLGTLAGSLAGRFLGSGEADVRAGLQGFCGALVGAATFAAVGGQWQGYLITVVGGALCAPLTWLLGRAFARHPLRALALPPTTAPFCIVATAIFLATGPLQVDTALLPVEPTDQEAFIQSLLTNISQVVLVDSVLGGALILLGLFIAGWKVGLAAILGSVVGSICALAMNVSLEETGHGLAGYSGVLTAIGFAAVFIKGKWLPWILAVVGSTATAVVTLLMHRLSIPTYTWPYVLTLWAGLALVHVAPRLHRA